MTWLIVVLAVVLVLAAVAAYKWQSSAALRRRFGPEYERILAHEGGDQRRADAALRHRTKRRAALRVRDLTPAAHTRFGERWHALQGHFVDDPRGAVVEAAQLARSVVHERGYHADDPDMAEGPDAPVYDELDLVAVDHPGAVSGFRAADETVGNRGASTEQLRQAFQGYKALFLAVMVKGEEAETTDRPAVAPVATPPRGEIERRTVVVGRRHDGDGDAAARTATDTGTEAGAPAEEGHGDGLLGRFRRRPAEPDPQLG